MTATFTAYPTEAEWLEVGRKQLITSSDLPIILGLSKFLSPMELWRDKMGQVEQRESNYIMRRGHGMEAFIAAEYARATGRYVYDPGDYTIASREWRGCTLDRLFLSDPTHAYQGDVEQLDGVLEMKAPTPYGMHNYSRSPGKSGVVQVQWQMHVTGRRIADVAVDLGTRLEIFRVKANSKLQRALEREAIRFREYIATGTPPPADGHPRTARALAEFFSDPVEETVTFGTDAREQFDRIKVAKDEVKKLKAEQSEAENWFRRELGQATRGIAPDLSFEIGWRPDKNGTRRFKAKEIEA